MRRMKNHILVVSRSIFKEVCEGGRGINPKYAAISIHDPSNRLPDGTYSEASPIILPDAPNVLNLWFNDEEEYNPETESVLFTEEMADTILAFVKQNEMAEFWLIHCTMGKCRSGAVGGFLADCFGISWEDFKRDNPQILPNSLVSNLLTRKLLENFVK